MKYQLRCSYNGSRFVGFQSQKNGLAIQDVLEQSLSRYLKEEIKLVFASRTDAKVHAFDQVCHFQIEQVLDCAKVQYHVNQILPDDIKITCIKSVSDRFHCQHDIQYKQYRYIISTNPYDVFNHNRAYICYYQLDVSKMKKIAMMLTGYHDFSSFNTTPHSLVADQHKKLLKIEVQEQTDCIVIDFYGNSFLRHMVRMMVGIMVDAARGKITLADVQNMLDEPSKDKHHRYNITGSGLYLMKIQYFDTVE